MELNWIQKKAINMQCQWSWKNWKLEQSVANRNSLSYRSFRVSDWIELTTSLLYETQCPCGDHINECTIGYLYIYYSKCVLKKWKKCNKEWSAEYSRRMSIICLYTYLCLCVYRSQQLLKGRTLPEEWKVLLISESSSV